MKNQKGMKNQNTGSFFANLLAWLRFPIVNDFGAYPDAEGNFPKPDINILAPAGTAFTAPFSGTVSGVDTSSSFGDVVTVNLDAPINDVATHYAFLHLSDITAHVGQHVTVGDILGHGGGGQAKSGAPPGFALTASDQYGYGAGWANNVKGTWINPKLNPTGVLGNLSGQTTCDNSPFGQADCNSGACNFPGIGGALCPCCVGTSIVNNSNPSSSFPSIDPAIATQVGIIIFGVIIMIIGLNLMFKGK